MTVQTIKYIAFITRMSDGVTREWHSDIPPEYRDTNDNYMWCDGNYACDCNRKQFFEEAADEYDEHGDTDETYPCGDTGYRVEKLVYEDGVVVVIDDL